MGEVGAVVAAAIVVTLGSSVSAFLTLAVASAVVLAASGSAGASAFLLLDWLLALISASTES